MDRLNALEGHLAMEILIERHPDFAQTAAGQQAQRPIAQCRRGRRRRNRLAGVAGNPGPGRGGAGRVAAEQPVHGRQRSNAALQFARQLGAFCA